MVSATAAIKNRMKAIGWTRTNQTECDCTSTIPPSESVPLTITTLTIETPRISSYETTWAAARSAPSSEYFDPEPQPPSTSPYTPRLLAAST